MKFVVICLVIIIVGFLIMWRLVYVASIYDEKTEEFYKKFFQKEVENGDKNNQ